VSKTLSERLAALSPEKRKLLGMSLGTGEGQSKLPRVSRTERHPLTASQEQIWLETQLNADPALYNESVQLRFDGPLDVEALRRAAGVLVDRHEAWRTRIVEEDGRAWQRVDAAMELPWQHRRASAEQLPALLEELVRVPFELARGPVLSWTLIELEPQAHVLVLVVHHVAFDGQSAAIYAEELLAAYEAFVHGREPAMPPLSAQLLDSAAVRATTDYAADLDWWCQALDGAPATLELLTDLPRPEQRGGEGARLHFELGEARSAALRELARELSATPFAVLVSLLSWVLRVRTRQSELVLGTPVSVRGPELAGVIGPFLNTVALRMRMPAEEATFEDLVRHAREVLGDASAHGQAPLQQLLAKLARPRHVGRTPLFEVLINLYKTRPQTGVGDLRVTRMVVEQGTARFDLALDVEDGPTGFSGWWEYDTALFFESTIVRFHAHLGALLDAVAEQPRMPLAALPRMSADEARALESYNESEAELGPPACIHTLFDEQARRTPDALALIEGDRRLTFAQLARRAWGLARVLVEHGVTPDSVVGVCADRSIDMVVAVLAVLEAGAGYLPLDPAYPVERLVFMLEDARASLVIGHRRHLERLAASTRQLALESDWADANEPPRVVANPNHVAYMAYTSGSTGRPNGVLGLHRGMVNRFRWMWTRFPFVAGEVGSQKTALSFLDSCWEMFGPLLQGVPVALVPDAAVKDPRALVECLARHRVSRLVLVPSLLKALLDTHPRLGEDLPALRMCVSSGEALPVELVRRFHASVPAALLINLYGSSELSADTTCCVLDSAQPHSWNSIGRPIANTHVYVVDEANRAQPIGVAGEICVSGVGLARGYWQRPELDARRFVQNPFERGGPIMHRTGDLGRWRADGELEYLGRVDQQIKVRGYRVEPGEIERVLIDDPEISAAIVGLREQRLIAWYVAKAPLPVPTLRSMIAEVLPEFMIPSHFVHLDSLPHTPSGKIDRHRLPLPAAERGELGTPYERPRNELERTIAAVWAEHLGLDRVGVLDNFFELGGHSLLLVEVYSALQARLGRELTMMELFRHPSVRALARHLEPGESVSRDARANPAATRGRSASRASTRRAARAGQVTLDASAETISLEACDATIGALVQRVLSDELGRALGPTEVFFAVGGTPEHASRAIARLTRELGVALPSRALLQAPTARQLGLYIQSARREPSEDGWACELGSSERPAFPAELRWEAAALLHGRVDRDMLTMAARTLARHHGELGAEGSGWKISLGGETPTRVSVSVAATLADPTSTCALLRELLAHYAGLAPQPAATALTVGDLQRWRARGAADLVARGWPRPDAPVKLDVGPAAIATLPWPVSDRDPAELLGAWTQLVGSTTVLASAREHAAVANLVGPIDTFVHVEPGSPEHTRDRLLWAIDQKQLGDDIRTRALFWDHGPTESVLPSLPGIRVEPLGPRGWQRRFDHELHIVGQTLHVSSPRADELAAHLKCFTPGGPG
jgi:amino acid adenylation domain-containing protein